MKYLNYVLLEDGMICLTSLINEYIDEKKGIAIFTKDKKKTAKSRRVRIVATANNIEDLKRLWNDINKGEQNNEK